MPSGSLQQECWETPAACLDSAATTCWLCCDLSPPRTPSAGDQLFHKIGRAPLPQALAARDLANDVLHEEGRYSIPDLQVLLLWASTGRKLWWECLNCRAFPP